MSSVESAATQQLIACECRQLVLSQGIAGALATVGVSSLFVLAVREVHPAENLTLWAVGVLAVCLLRVILAIWAKATPLSADNRLPNTPALCLLVGALAGGAWGMAATWLFPLGYHELYFVTAFLLIGMPAGAISSFGAWWPSYAAYVLASVGPFAVYFLLADRNEFQLAGWAACLFGLFLLREGYVIGRTIQRNIAQRIALMDMTRSLGEALDRADEASRAKSSFLTNMSHELRTPLNAIIGMSELLAEAPDAPAHRHLPDSIRRAGKALLALISDVLDLSQIEAGKIALRHAAFAPRRLVDEVMDIFGPEAAAKSLRLQVECSPDVPAQFMADAARLRQILVNLVGNAVKFTPSGEVRVEMHCAGVDAAKTLWIDVVDSGVGVRESDRERIFNAFQQLDATTSREHAGSGLGLKISRDLAQLMGGTLDVAAAQGGGSRFRLRIPQAAAQTAARPGNGTDLGIARLDHAPDATGAAPVAVASAETDVLPMSSPLQAAPEPTAQRPVPALRVLVVEDNSVNAALIKLMLERFGCAVDCIANGVQALVAMRGEAWDIVLMDCQMPQLDGYETTRRWRAIEAEDGRARLPIVALTAHAMTGDREKCLAAGMDDYLTKPIVLDDLRQLLHRHSRDVAEPRVEAVAP